MLQNSYSESRTMMKIQKVYQYCSPSALHETLAKAYYSNNSASGLIYNIKKSSLYK